MKLRKTIRTTASSAVLAALVSVLVIIGSTFDMLDLSCAAAASLIIHLAMTEIDSAHAFMIYACAAILSFLASPMRSCTLFFAAFFGYYPLVRAFLAKHIRNKKLYYLLLFAFYNAVMLVLFLLFKGFRLAERGGIHVCALTLVVQPVFRLFRAVDRTH